MSNEPDITFSGKLGGMRPPGEYTYPAAPGSPDEKNPVRVYIHYPYVPGVTPVDQNPGLLEDK